LARPTAPPRDGAPPTSPAREPQSETPPQRPAGARLQLQQALVDFKHAPLGDLTAVVLSLGAALSPLFGGYWSETVWSAVGLCVVVAAGAMVAFGRLPMPRGAALVAVAGLCGLGLFALLSTLWSTSPDGAVVSAGRVLAYGAVVLLVLGLARDRRRRGLIIGALAAGLAVVALFSVARLFGSGAPSMFLGGRLSSPLGYAGGTGCAFVLGAWLWIGVAVRPKPLVAGVGAFGVVLMISLVVLTESRSAVPAAALAVIAVSIVQPSSRTIWAVLVAACGVAAAFPVLANAYSSTGGNVSASHAHAAGLGALVAAAATGVVWGVATAVIDRVRVRQGNTKVVRASRFGLITVAAAAIVAGVIGAGAISREASKQWKSFQQLTVVSPAETHGNSRFLEAGGPLKEYWRVALTNAKDHPVAGTGAGSWTKVWFQERRYYDQVWQPNSIVFGTVAESGTVGVLLLAAFVGGTAVAAWRVRRRKGKAVSPRMVAAVGVGAAALSYATTDWIWTGLPGVMAIGLVAIGVVLAASDAHPPRRSRRSRRRRSGSSSRTRPAPMAWRVGAFAVLAVSATVLGRMAVAGNLRDAAEDNLVANPAAALNTANTALSVNPNAVQSDYIKAAALAHLHRADQARAALLEAARQEPDNFVTWALLGDLDVRRGAFDDARAEYRRAAQLDPLDKDSDAGIPADPVAAAKLGGPGPVNVAHRPGVTGYQIVKDTSPLELARAIGAPGVKGADEVIVGLFGYGIG